MDALCTRCELVLAHTVIAVVEGRPVKVECNTCHGVHAYRGPAGKPGGRVARAERPARERKVEISFEALLASRKGAPVPYSPKRTFAVDEVVDHPTFGRGFVTEVRGDKVAITFRSDVKTLVHGRS